MKKSLLRPTLVALLACYFIGACKNQNPRPAAKQEAYEMEEEGKVHNDHPGEAMAFEVERTKDPKLGYVPRQHLLEAFDQIKSHAISNREQGALPNILWNERGPSNVGGRTRSIAIDGNDPSGNTIWAGSVGGGLWKCTNFTTTSYNWTPVNDVFPNLAVTAIFQNPVNKEVMYFGTGEGYGNSDALQGGGMWKSNNGGITWTQLASTAVTSSTSTFSYIQKLLIKQVAGTEYLFVATRNGGVRLSTDGGATFSTSLAGTSGRAADLELAANGDIYAGMGLSGSGDGIYRSTDNGTTWVKSIGGLPTTGYGRIELATAPNADSVVYATFQSSANSRALGIYKTTNFGTTWTAVTNANGGLWASTQAWYDMIIAVDPTNANHVVIGGLDTYNSLDGGATWTAMSSWFGGPPQYIHADNHEMKFFVNSANQTCLYFGNDGGIFFSPNASATVAIPTAIEKNNGYNVTQFYHGAIGPIPGSNKYLAGAQDNGTQYFTNAGINNTTAVTGGDGAFCHIDDDNPNIQISQYVYNQYFITNNNWANYATVNISSSAGRFINPTDYDSRTNTLYGAYTSNNYSLINGVGSANSTATRAATAFGGTVSAVKVSPNTLSRVYFGISTGRIVRVDNANSATPVLTNITATIPAVGYISEIAVQEGDDNHIIYCISSFGTNSVWETTNGGTTWTSIEGNFTADLPVRAIMFSPGSNTQAFIGTDIGVYSTDNLNGTNTVWGETNDGLARVSVQHLEYRKGDGTMIAVTHGRGLYTSSSLESPSVYFANGNQTVTEAASIVNGCRKYADINIPVVLSKNASAPVQVNILPNLALSTATAGQDFEVITPMPLVFNSGSTQNITVRVYDDAATEGFEMGTLEISIANASATNARVGAGYLDFIAINDNDKTPEVAGANVIVFSENWESGMGTWTGFGTGTATAPNAWGIFSNCDNSISNQTAVIYNQPANTCGYDNAKVTTSSIYRTFDATGRNNLSIEFDWKGFGEIGYDQGQVVFDTTTGATPVWQVLAGATGLSGNTGIIHQVAALPAQLSNRSFRIGFRWTNDDNTGSNPAFSVDNINIISTLPAAIQLAVNPLTSPTHYVGAMETVHYYDNSGNIMATLKNNNNVVLGCVKIEVDRAGGGSNVPFWSADTATFLSAKTYKITAPDAPASGLNYNITLYYTQAEINTWKAGTGYTENDPKIVKITGHTISEATPANPYVSSVTVAASVNKLAYNINNFAYTASFSSFSGFGLGVPLLNPLPVTTLDFKGVLNRNKAVLSWTTLTEINNKGFYLEKSLNGRNFSNLAFVKGNGNTVVSHAYSYNDFDISTSMLYYRLKQVDFDGRFTYSRIVQLQNQQNALFTVLPNPFRSSVQVYLGEAATKVQAQLYAMNGGRVYAKDLQLNGQSSLTLNLSSVNLAKGEYILVVTYNDKKRQVKLMKE